LIKEINKMGKLIIKGGNRLEGTVTLSGAKNSALKVLCASILTSEKIRLFNMPTKMEDVKTQIGMLESIGAKVEIKSDEVFVDNSKIDKWDISSSNKDRNVRTSLLLLGSLLGRFGKARVPLPGGCKIGERPYDLHVYALELLGAKVRVTDGGYIEAECDKLRGAEIEFPIRTTGGTENSIIAACLAQGKTIIKNAHTRPEVIDLANFLNSMGAKVKIIGSGYIEVEGVSELYGTTYRIIPDNVEALTFIIAAAVTKGDIEIDQFPVNTLEIPIIYLRESGVSFYVGVNSLRITGNKKFTPVDLSTGSYPGINSDFQPLFAIFATQAEGKSRITDIRFTERFEYVKELNKMGANIVLNGNTAVIQGETKLKGAKVNAVDLRAGAALINAGLCAEGETAIENVYQIDRGYEQIEEKLSALGAEVKKVRD